MRIINRSEFLKMPGGTLYAKCEPCIIDQLSFKGKSIGDSDWYYNDFAMFENNDSGEYYDRFMKMIEKNVSYPVDFTQQRDGLYDDSDLFLIYELDDLHKLQEQINYAIQAATPPNEEQL